MLNAEVEPPWVPQTLQLRSGSSGRRGSRDRVERIPATHFMRLAYTRAKAVHTSSANSGSISIYVPPAEREQQPNVRPLLIVC